VLYLRNTNGEETRRNKLRKKVHLVGSYYVKENKRIHEGLHGATVPHCSTRWDFIQHKSAVLRQGKVGEGHNFY
jgi:hypothetical protein